jgi:hypothetical protein
VRRAANYRNGTSLHILLLVDEDLVLVLDVNKKYGPWLVKPARLYEAMNTLDGGALKKRGLLLME